MKLDIRRRRIWIPALIGLVVVLLVIVRIVQATSAEEAAPTVDQIRAEQGLPVTVATAESGALEIWRDFNGTVSGVQEGVVRARSSDQIARVLVNVGSRVSRGQVLVQQSGQATDARARQAEAARRQAASNVERLRPLHSAGAISDQEWEAAQVQLELATADLAAARGELTLTSPLAGTVTEVVARPGMVPSVGDPLVRVADLSELVVYARLTATDAMEVRTDQPARLANMPTAGGPVSGDLPGTPPRGSSSSEQVRAPATGTVRRIALQADPETRLVEVQVGFPPSAGLIPGTLASIQIRTAQRESALQVPRAAVRDGAVWVVDADNRVTRRPVQVGLQSRDFAEILSGLSAGERVVVEGGALLSDGARVRTVGTGAE
jgi:RND family efflux transporter MFP subunit